MSGHDHAHLHPPQATREKHTAAETVAATPFALSLLRTGAGMRVGVAAVMVAVLWLLVWLAVAGS
jgi:hypothetical protein